MRIVTTKNRATEEHTLYIIDGEGATQLKLSIPHMPKELAALMEETVQGSRETRKEYLDAFVQCWKQHNAAGWGHTLQNTVH